MSLHLLNDRFRTVSRKNDNSCGLECSSFKCADSSYAPQNSIYFRHSLILERPPNAEPMTFGPISSCCHGCTSLDRTGAAGTVGDEGRFSIVAAKFWEALRTPVQNKRQPLNPRA
jgi:hypothetical protein